MTVGLSDRLRKIRRAVLVAIVSPPPSSNSAASLAFASIRRHRFQWVCTSPRRTLRQSVEFCPVEPFATLSIVRGYLIPEPAVTVQLPY